MQSSEDESFLRRILYDAAILVEYSFLSPEKAVNITANHVRDLAVKRLIITHEALELFRFGICILVGVMEWVGAL